MYIDTHVHLDLEQFPDVGDVIETSVAAGVEAFINIGFDPERWRSTMELAAAHPRIAYTLGFHPGSSRDFNRESAEHLADLVRRSSPVGIGEAGIDLFHLNNPPLEMQRAAFDFQIALAVENDLPLVIHQRNAEDHVREHLESAPSDLRVVLHSFEGSRRLLDLAIERGWFIGIGGLMTRRSSPVRDVLMDLPLDRFVLETDSPYLVPAGLNERRNTPANIPLIAERFAGLRGLPVTTVADAARQNSVAAFPRLARVLDGITIPS